MFGFLGFIFIIFLVIILFAIALLGNLLRFIFGFGRSTPKPYSNQDFTPAEEPQAFAKRPSTQKENSKKKIFNEEDGEYVEFEEVK